jgi:hypothetical protein
LRFVLRHADFGAKFLHFENLQDFRKCTTPKEGDEKAGELAATGSDMGMRRWTEY